MKQSGERDYRRWRLVHLWLGLLLGLPLALVSLAGLPVTYWDATERITAPSFYPPGAGPHRFSLDRAIGRAAEAVPGARVTSLYIIESGTAAHVKVETREGAAREVAMSLRNGAALGVRDPAQAPVFLLYDFHTRMWLGEAGPAVVLALAAALVAASLTGMVLWWPGGGKVLRSLRPRLRRGRRWRDGHVLLGLYTLAPILVAAVTTIILVWPGLKSDPPASTVTAPADRPAPPPNPMLDPVQAQLQAMRPALRLRSVRQLGDSRAALSGTAQDRGGQLWLVLISRRSGAVLAVEPVAEASRDAVVRHVHTGTIGGEVGRAMMAFAAVVPALLLVTGVIWWLRRKMRRSGSRDKA